MHAQRHGVGIAGMNADLHFLQQLSDPLVWKSLPVRGVDHTHRVSAVLPGTQIGQGAVRLHAVQTDQQVGVALAHHGTAELTQLQMGHDRAAALGHAKGLRPQHRHLLVPRYFDKDFGRKKNPLATDPGNDGLRFHACSFTGWIARGWIAPCAQTWMQMPQSMQVRRSISTRPSGRRCSEGHSNQVVQ